jgi:hypothetical protein
MFEFYGGFFPGLRITLTWLRQAAQAFVAENGLLIKTAEPDGFCWMYN